jgi:hypothetical protein
VPVLTLEEYEDLAINVPFAEEIFIFSSDRSFPPDLF